MFQACCACGGGSNAGFYRDNATLTVLSEIFDSLGGPYWVHNDGVCASVMIPRLVDSFVFVISGVTRTTPTFALGAG